MNGPRLSSIIPLAFVALLASCAEEPVSPDRPGDRPKPSGPGLSILDAAHNQGNAHFFFLPPMVSAPVYQGTFDPSQAPLVRICEMAGSRCGPVVADFLTTAGTGSQTIRVDETAQHYIVNWHTDQCVTGGCDLDPAKTYRIRVMVGALELGHADLQVVSNGAQLKNVNTNEYVGLVDGRTLPIKFRIEAGAVASVVKGEPAVVGPAGGTIATKDGEVSLEFPAGALTATKTITVETATDAPPTEAWSEPVNLGPDGTTFAQPVVLTLAFDPSLLPPGVPVEAMTILTSDGTGWVAVDGAQVNVADNTVSAPITHFSYYWIGINPNGLTYSSNGGGYGLNVGETRRLIASVGYVTTSGGTRCYPRYSSSGRYLGQTCYSWSSSYHYPMVGWAVFWTSNNQPVVNIASGPTYTNSGGNAESPPMMGVSPGNANVSARSYLGNGQNLTTSVSVVVAHPAFVFTRYVGSARDLYTMSRTGVLLRRLTFNGATTENTEPAVSPDGTKIVYRSGPEIYVLNADGSGTRQLLVSCGFSGGPSWSPTGKISYHSGCSGSYEIWTMNADGTGKTMLDVPGTGAASTAWSPDGEWIAYRSDAAGSGLDLWMVRPDGTGARRITTGAAADDTPQWSPDARHLVHQCGIDLCITDAIDATTRVLLSDGFRNEAPKWSRDGTTISFGSTKAGIENIWEMPADGSGPPVRVTTNSLPEGHPAWLGPLAPPPPAGFVFLRLFGPVADIFTMSKDGTYPKRVFGDGSQNQDPQIAVDGTRRIVFRGNNHQIRTIGLDGTNLTTLTGCGFNSGPHWSPDGAKITFYSDCNGSAISIMNRDGTGRAKLNNPAVSGGAPSWSPDGQWIAFYSNMNGPYDIYVMRSDGTGTPRQLTATPESDGTPEWSPDGTKLVYTCVPHICTIDVATATATRVIPNAQTAMWSPDGTRLVFSAGIEGRFNMFEMKADGTGPRRRLTIHSLGDEGAASWIP